MQRSTIALVTVMMVLAAAVGGAGLAVALADADGGSPPAATQTADGPTATKTISVSATGQAKAKPDKAVLEVAVEATSPNATTARSWVAENVTAVRNALTELGINESQIVTTDYNIYKDERPRPVEGKETGSPVFQARHVLSIEVSDIDMVGKVIDRAVAAGATNINDVRFTLSRETRQTLRNEALRDAMENARGQAETLAQQADLKIEGVHRVQTSDVRGPRYMMETTFVSAAAGAADTSVNSGPVTVVANVHVTYNATG
ncbi:MAG: SIMPL domain-containing protein [Halodesulfurarchaeum sp.]